MLKVGLEGQALEGCPLPQVPAVFPSPPAREESPQVFPQAPPGQLQRVFLPSTLADTLNISVQTSLSSVGTQVT